MKKTTTLLTAIISLAITGTGYAATLGFDFESPTYSVGDITGQDAWTNAGNTGDITATSPIVGSQSAQSTDISPTSSVYDLRDITGLRTWADGTRLSTLFRTDNNGTAGSFFDFRVDTTAGFVAAFNVYSHSAFLYVRADDGTIAGSITEGTVYQAVLEFDFTADTYDLILQSVNQSNPLYVTGTIGSALDIPFGNSSSAAQAAAGTDLRLRAQNGGAGVAGARIQWDNMLIESEVIPEPSILALIAIGGLAFVLRRDTDAACEE